MKGQVKVAVGEAGRNFERKFPGRLLRHRVHKEACFLAIMHTVW